MTRDGGGDVLEVQIIARGQAVGADEGVRSRLKGCRRQNGRDHRRITL